jgi:carboxylesterase
MSRNPQVDPSSFLLEGDGSRGALLVHGFTGSPPEMRLIAGYLNERGYTVSAPLLPGHGTTIEDMNRRKWPEWTEHVRWAYHELKSRCDKVFVGGLSMGSLLSVTLASQNPEIPALALYAPAVWVMNRLIHLTPVMKHVLPVWHKSGKSDLGDPDANSLLWHYDGYPVAAAHELLKATRRVRRILPEVKCPTIVFHAARDKHLRGRDVRRVADRLGSAEKDLVVLEKSGHCLTVDLEWKSVARRTYAFFEDHLA